MELELKNIKHTAWASEETHCYQASLYVDGKPLAIVGNAGSGGPDYEHPHSRFKGDFQARMSEVREYFTTLPTIPTPLFEQGFTQDLWSWCIEEVDDWISARELKEHLKKSYLFHFADGAGVYAEESRPSYTAAVVLNDLPFADALAIWKETA